MLSHGQGRGPAGRGIRAGQTLGGPQGLDKGEPAVTVGRYSLQTSLSYTGGSRIFDVLRSLSGKYIVHGGSCFDYFLLIVKRLACSSKGR